jgi:hypothetical protein
MKKIGLISDTHSFLDLKVLEFFEEVDEIWHAGDIGDLQVTDALKKIKPLRAVYGNIDDASARLEFPFDLHFELEGFTIWMTHIGGYPNNYVPRVKKLLDEKAPDIFVCGHSHILRVMRDEKYNNMLTINSGAAGVHGFHKVKTILRFTLDDKKITQMEAIELGKRGEISQK